MIFASSKPSPDAAPVTINTLPARDGRSLSVKVGAGGKMAENKEGMVSSSRVRLRLDID